MTTRKRNGGGAAMDGQLSAGQRLGRIESAHEEQVRACEQHRRHRDLRLARIWEELSALKVELAKTTTKVAILVGVLCTLGNLAISLLLKQWGS
jgi:hypothetical protein